MAALPPEVYRLIDAALTEDETFNDPTTGLLIPPDLAGLGMLRAKAAGVLAGLEVAQAVFRRVDPELDFAGLLPEGAALTPGTDLARIAGSAASILRAERIALNFLQRMSGIASDTRRYVQAIAGCPARIVDTRKTAPGHRYLDKYAVRMGGGYNHRRNLADGILIKDNHLAALAARGLGLQEVVQRAMAQASHTVKVEVEVETLAGVAAALDAGAPIIMLDNMPLEMLAAAMELVGDRAVVEASGGINLNTVRTVAETGVHLISIGSLTHSTQALDISLDLEFPG